MDYFCNSTTPALPGAGHPSCLGGEFFEKNCKNYCTEVLFILLVAFRICINISLSALTFSGYWL